jgi:hypothetical protein
MMRVLIAWVFLLAVAGCNAADVADKLPDAKQRAAAEERYLKGLNELRKQFNEKEYGKARIVPKGAKPEIILQDDTILFNGKPLVLGAPLQDWKDIFSAPHRCTKPGKISPIACTWDELGIQILTSSSNKDIVSQLTIYLNPRPTDPFDPNSRSSSKRHLFPDDKSERLEVDSRQPFTGYLELDNFGIDAKTQFWEIRTNVKLKRNLRCSSRECFPHGYFSEYANIYMALDQNSEKGRLFEFTIASDQ